MDVSINGDTIAISIGKMMMKYDGTIIPSIPFYSIKPKKVVTHPQSHKNAVETMINHACLMVYTTHVW